jgi:hypothetical protein
MDLHLVWSSHWANLTARAETKVALSYQGRDSDQLFEETPSSLKLYFLPW